MTPTEQARIARQILGEETDFGVALGRIGSEWARPVSRHALKGLFRREGLASPSTFLGEPMYQPARGDDTLVELPAAPAPPRFRDTLPVPEWERPTEVADVERILFVPDVHRPYHDEAAFSLAIRVGEAFLANEPRSRRRVVDLGDFADFYKVSDHMKNPHERLSFPREVEDVNHGLDELETLKAGTLDFVEGNHEWRFARYLMQRAPELIGLPSMSVPELFNFAKRGWSYTPYMDHLSIGKLYVTHEEGNAGPYANIRARASFEHNVLIGHTHRLAESYQGNAVGETHVGVMGGWLGSFEKIDYAHRVKARQWSHGVVLGYHERATGVVHLRLVPFIGGRAMVEGQIVR